MWHVDFGCADLFGLRAHAKHAYMSRILDYIAT